MTANRQEKLKANLTIRARVIQAIRRFFIDNGYLEVETPIRLPAVAPESHIEPVASGDWFLQTSPELCMKRLLAAGYSRIFQICKCFRRGERGRLHLPEMTLLEWYRAGSGYLDMMDECEALIGHVARQVNSKTAISYQGIEIDLTPPWRRISVAEAFKKYTSLTMEAALKNDRFDEIMAAAIGPGLGQPQPLFVYDYPAERGALARLKPHDCRHAERFELYIVGLEICNAFGELTDAVEQKGRFDAELDRRRKAGKQAYPMPDKFLDALKEMPEACGNALGIDRLVMLFADAETIDDVVTFIPEEL